ncbi:MAG: hypothetical protein AAF581_15905 [Planctomycetota bacterium]
MSRPVVGLTLLGFALLGFLGWQLFATHRQTQEQLEVTQQMQGELQQTLRRQDARSKSWRVVQQRLEELDRKLRALASGAQLRAADPADSNSATKEQVDLDGLSAEVAAIREQLAAMQAAPPQNGFELFVNAANQNGAVVLTGETVTFQPTVPVMAPQTTATGSNPGALRWDVDQFLGEPDSPAGDHATAWASKEPDGGEEWIEAEFADDFVPDSILIRENFNPGAVVRVEALDASQQWHTVWSGNDPTQEVPGDFIVPGSSFATRVVRVTLDTKRVKGWNEIDAVGLVVGNRTHWAVAGGASSSWAERYDRK